MLAFDPNKRITVEEALAHPYLTELHCPEDEPTTEHVSAFDFDFEIYELKN
jgi:serine/threonine protein kinase